MAIPIPIPRVIMIMLIIMASVIIQIAYADSGEATFYTEYTPSACYGNTDEGVMIAAANPTLYDNGNACGEHYKVKCTGSQKDGGDNPCRGGHVKVKIVDLCPDCADDQLDLSQDAFSQIADPNAGVVRINYVQV